MKAEGGENLPHNPHDIQCRRQGMTWSIATTCPLLRLSFQVGASRDKSLHHRDMTGFSRPDQCCFRGRIQFQLRYASNSDMPIQNVGATPVKLTELPNTHTHTHTHARTHTHTHIHQLTEPPCLCLKRSISLHAHHVRTSIRVCRHAVRSSINRCG